MGRTIMVVEKSIIIPYLECVVEARDRIRRICIDSYFIRRVVPINVSLLVYPCKVVMNYTTREKKPGDIVLNASDDCKENINYIIDVYRDLKSDSLKVFKRMYWYNISNLIVPVRFSPLMREKLDRYEKVVGELTASVMLLDRVLGKEVLRGNYSVIGNGVKNIKLTLSITENKVIFSNGILGKIYTRLYESDELFRKEILNLLNQATPP